MTCKWKSWRKKLIRFGIRILRSLLIKNGASLIRPIIFQQFLLKELSHELRQPQKSILRFAKFCFLKKNLRLVLLVKKLICAMPIILLERSFLLMGWHHVVKDVKNKPEKKQKQGGTNDYTKRKTITRICNFVAASFSY